MSKQLSAPSALNTQFMGLQPRPAQMIILRRLALYRFVVAVCHRRLGKTRLAVDWLIEEGLRFMLEGYRGYYFCNTQKQAKIVSWNYFKRALDPLKRIGLVDFNETELRIDLPNDGKIYLGSAESIENYRGIYIDRIVMDEIASWINAEYAYAEVLRPAMADREAHALIIGTVKGLNQFYNFYQFGISDDPALQDWCTVDLKASMTGILPESELKMLQATMSRGAYEREFENNFFANIPDVLITAIEVVEAMRRAHDPYLTALAPVIVGIDIGLTGDPSMICIRQGRHVRPLIEVKSEDPMLTATLLSRELKVIQPQPTTIYGDAGQGLAVLSRLRDLGHSNVVDVYFGGASDRPDCFNKRAAMAQRCKESLQYASLPKEDDELLQEAVNQHLEEDPNRKVRLVKKRKIREIIGRSPNRMDAWMLTHAEEDEQQDDIYELAKTTGLTPQQLVAYKRVMDTVKSQQTQTNDYDVLDYFNREEDDQNYGY